MRRPPTSIEHILYGDGSEPVVFLPKTRESPQLLITIKGVIDPAPLWTLLFSKTLTSLSATLSLYFNFAKSPTMPLSSPTVMLLSLSVLAVLTALASGHGLMCTPRQRGAYHNDKCGSNMPSPENPVIDYCAHCLNGGTVETVKRNMPRGGWKVYEPTKDFPGTGERAGICGDPKGNDDHMLGGSFMPYESVPMVDNYKSGSVIDFTAEIDTNHNGYFDYFLCNLDACGTADIEKKCFMEGHCHKLLRVKHPDCENTNVNTQYECGPVDPKYPGRWYLPCRKTAHVGVHIVGGSKGTMRYKLPEGVECKHCVIQWYWATANSCAPRGFLDYFEAFNGPFGNTCESDGGGRGAYRQGMAECGGELAPEEFWSCADVQITKDGKAAGAVESVGKPNTSTNDAPEEQSTSESSAPSSSPAPEPTPENVTTTSGDASETDNNGDVWGTDNNGDASETGNNGDASKADNRDESFDNSGDSSDNGACLESNASCDGSIPCCDMKQVCVYSEEESRFACRYWRDLWKDVKKREAAMK